MRNNFFDDRIMEGERSGVALAHWGPSAYPSSALVNCKEIHIDTHRPDGGTRATSTVQCYVVMLYGVHSPGGVSGYWTRLLPATILHQSISYLVRTGTNGGPSVQYVSTSPLTRASALRHSRSPVILPCPGSVPLYTQSLNSAVFKSPSSSLPLSLLPYIPASGTLPGLSRPH